MTQAASRILMISKLHYSGKNFLSEQFGRVWEFSRGLAQLGHDVSGIAVDYRAAQRYSARSIPSPGSPKWRTVGVPAYSALAWLHWWRVLRAEADRLCPDIIWGGSDAINVITATALARRRGVPVVLDLYDNFEAFWPTRLPGVHAKYRSALQNADVIVCVSAPLREKIRGDLGRQNRIEILENGVTPDFFVHCEKNASRERLGLPKDACLIGTAGGLTRGRGIETLLSAMKEMNDDGLKLRLVLAGPTDLPGREMSDESVVYLGELPHFEIPALFCALDVGVVMNLDTRFGRYCFPLKAMEMEAVGLPMVSASVGVMNDIMRDLRPALFEPKDSVDLARALRYQIRNGQLTGHFPLEWDRLSEKLSSIVNGVVTGRTWVHKY